jgi:hypothetical protein
MFNFVRDTRSVAVQLPLLSSLLHNQALILTPLLLAASERSGTRG